MVHLKKYITSLNPKRLARWNKSLGLPNLGFKCVTRELVMPSGPACEDILNPDTADDTGQHYGEGGYGPIFSAVKQLIISNSPYS